MHKHALTHLLFIVCLSGMGGIPPFFKQRAGTDPFRSDRPRAGEQLELVPEGGGAPWFGVCIMEPYFPYGPVVEGAELMVDLWWLVPLNKKDFYKQKNAELPQVWKLAEPSTQSFACVDHWGTLFEVENGNFHQLRGKALSDLTTSRESADAMVKEVNFSLSRLAFSMFKCCTVANSVLCFYNSLT
jgi:hypothetical protein